MIVHAGETYEAALARALNVYDGTLKLELVDVVTFNDVTGSVQCRITELHTTWFPLQGHHDLVLVGEGV